MSAPEPRPIVRHRLTRHRFPGAGRPYPMVVAVLVALASVPMLAAVLAGSASLTTTGNPRTTAMAEPPQPPVVVPGRGDAGLAPVTPRPPVSSPTRPPSTAESPAVPVPPAGDTVTVSPRSPRNESGRVGSSGFGSGSGSAGSSGSAAGSGSGPGTGSGSGPGTGSGSGPGTAPAPGAPAPAPGDGRQECTPAPGQRPPSGRGGSPSDGSGSGGSPTAPPARPAPAPHPGGDQKAIGIVGELLDGVGRLLGHQLGHLGHLGNR